MSSCSTVESFGYGQPAILNKPVKSEPANSGAYKLKVKESDWLIIVVAKRVFNAISITFHFIGEKIYGVYNFIYAKNPVTGVRSFWFVPTWIEQRVGENAFPSFILKSGGETFRPEIKGIISGPEQASKERSEGEPYQNPPRAGVAQRLIKIASEDRPELEYEIRAARSMTINAGCLPGGKIVINEGLIDQMNHEKEDFGIKGLTLEDKVAAILGHELVHATARHSARAIEKSIAFIFLTNILISSDLSDFLSSPYMLKCSRNHEFEADKFGMKYLDRAGFNPQAMIWVTKYFQKLDKVKPSTNRVVNFSEKVLNKISHVFSATHPTSKERVEASMENYKALMKAKGKKVTYLDKTGNEITSKNSGNDDPISIVIATSTKESKEGKNAA